mgnify:FL=1
MFTNIYAVGANYSAHNREMGRSTDERFLVFQKSTSIVLASGGVLPYPPDTKELHHEGELVVLLGEGGRPAAYAAGIDFTRRDLQREAKSRGEPWFPGKNFPGAAAIGGFVDAGAFEPIAGRRLVLTVGGQVRQEARLDEMLRDVPALLGLLARIVPLVPGDAVYTGTPSGVGPVAPGDVVRCEIEGLPPLEVRIGPPRE